MDTLVEMLIHPVKHGAQTGTIYDGHPVGRTKRERRFMRRPYQEEPPVDALATCATSVEMHGRPVLLSASDGDKASNRGWRMIYASL